MHIVELRASNVLRLRAVAIRPTGNMVILKGRNAQGKSSVLESITMALRGKRSVPQEPVRHGTRKAETVLDLGELIVEQVITAKGVQLTVKGKDGIEKASPQTLLDKLCQAVSFDPFAFSRMEPKKQDALLKELVGVDFSDIDVERAKLYAKRTDINKELVRLDAQLDQMTHHADAPKELVDVAALSGKIDAYQAALASRARATAPIDKLRAKFDAASERIDRLERELQDASNEALALRKQVDLATAELPPEPESIDPVREELRTAEEKNAKVRANADYTKVEKAAQETAAESEKLSANIETLDQKKAERLAAAKFPVDGLAFDEVGPTFKGVPLAQASQAERLRVSVAIGAALNPRLRILLVREGAFLDEESLRLLAEFAKETDSQIWLETVHSNDPSAICIEDGSVLESPPAAVVNGEA